MKTLSITRIISNQQSLRKCFGNFLSQLPSWVQDYWSLRKVQKQRNSEHATLNNSNSESKSKPHLWTMVTALAAQVGAVSNAKDIAKAFPRVITGLVLLVIVAPYADVFYTRLDFNARVSPEVWYYESYHWLFLCLGPYLKSIFQTIGLYLVFARGSSILSLIAVYALMFDIGKVFWLLQVTSHEEYKSLPTEWFLVYGFAAGLFIVLIMDRLTFWLHHRVNAIKARLMGLRNIADKCDPQITVDNFVRTMDEDVMVQQFKTSK